MGQGEDRDRVAVAGRGHIEAENLPADVPLKLRVPSCVRKPEVKESRSDGKAQIALRGELGHRIEHCDPGVIADVWSLGSRARDGTLPVGLSAEPGGGSGIPAGYVPRMLHPGVPTIKLQDKPDAEGFVKLPLCPPETAAAGMELF